MVNNIIDQPAIVETKFSNILEHALQQPTLEQALSYACLCESERAIDQARNRFGSGSNGAGWDTCFSYVIQETLKAYLEKNNLIIVPKTEV